MGTINRTSELEAEIEKCLARYNQAIFDRNEIASAKCFGEIRRLCAIIDQRTAVEVLQSSDREGSPRNGRWQAPQMMFASTDD